MQHLVYESLARMCEQRKDARLRDTFMVLAADAALLGGQPAEAERFRQRILARNPNHMLRPYLSFADALRSPDVLELVTSLKNQYPIEIAIRMSKGEIPLEIDQQGAHDLRRESSSFGMTDSSPGYPQMAEHDEEFTPSGWSLWGARFIFVLVLCLVSSGLAYVLARPFL